MSRCAKCEGKGWIETWHGAAASWTPSLSQCPNRCDISGYSREVQRRLSDPHHVTERPVLKSQPVQSWNVVPLRRLTDE